CARSGVTPTDYW
nr:immunoglobulin heavy chain junction region [Macaca mulatta]MOV36163.1 immunoglobulin heavy chain junction region [Macaca mulatta]MOV36380.1 immunoglobulin heavy chain junction region [Macaca mulatta]MOV36576.1 immunoglobulin heavy chain junction region [Macaca mulatta]